MATGTRVEVEHRDRGDIILELELADWIAWESWAGRSFVTFGDEKNPPGAKDVAYLGYEAAKRTGRPQRRFPLVGQSPRRLADVPTGGTYGPYPAGTLGRRRVAIALRTGTAPQAWTELADILTAEELLQQ
jgi:hypothetical protein